MGGTPVFAGTRVPVETGRLDDLEVGQPLFRNPLEDFPTVTREQAIATLQQARKALLGRCASRVTQTQVARNAKCPRPSAPGCTVRREEFAESMKLTEVVRWVWLTIAALLLVLLTVWGYEGRCVLPIAPRHRPISFPAGLLAAPISNLVFYFPGSYRRECHFRRRGGSNDRRRGIWTQCEG